MLRSYQLGNLKFVINNELGILSVNEELKKYLTDGYDVKEAEVRFNLIESIPELKGSAIKLDNLFVAQDSAIVSDFPFRYKLEESGGRLEVWIEIKKDLNALEKISNIAINNRLVHPTYKNKDETYGSDFMYKIFLPLVQIKLLAKGYTFAHSSGIDYQGKGYMFTSWGGIGKTTTLLKLLLTNSDVKFLADDMALVGPNAQLHYFSKFLHIYPYNWQGFPELQKVAYDSRDWIDKLNWKFWSTFRGKAVCRRVPPEQLFDKQIGESVKVETVFFLKRANVDQVKATVIEDQDSLFETMSLIMTKELSFIQKELIMLNSAGSKLLMRSLDYPVQVKEILKSSLGVCKLVEVKIPYRALPDDIYRFISKEIGMSQSTQ